MSVDPLDPRYLWVHAAECAACLGEVARWEWSDRATQAAEVAGRLAEAIYASQPASVVDALVLRLDVLIEDGFAFDPAQWLAELGSQRSVARLTERAVAAFARLRYLLYPEGRPRAA